MQTVLDSSVTKDYELGRSREWLVTNGLGSYASSTVIGLNTRGYHGLLVAALEPPVRRTLLVSKLEEEFDIGGRKYLLAVNRYPGIIYPQGYLHLDQFRFERYPVFTYKLGNTIIEKSVFMPYEENTTIITYKVIDTDSTIKMTIFPIVNYRDYHYRTKEEPGWSFSQTLNPKGVEIKPFAGAMSIYLQSDIAAYFSTGSWYKNFIYEIESDRGLPDREDQYNPGYFSVRLDRGSQISIMASISKRETFSPEGLRYREMARLRTMLQRLPQSDPFFLSLANAADTFLVKRKSTRAKTIVAGYHWFIDWGRDSMISLPGITLVTKRENEGKEIIRTFLSYLSDGLIPNVFPELAATDEKPAYNSIDAPLWLINACYELYSETGLLEFVQEVYPKLKEIVESYISGTRHGIVMDSDGLVRGGDGSIALTWMDAKVEGIPVTPRHGKPVEISALWYNALSSMSFFAKQFGFNSDAERYEAIAKKTRESFNALFWNEKKTCLHDVLLDDRGDGMVRPNQIFSISLPFPVLDEKRRREVLRTVESELLTPLGLRTLSPFDEEYIGNCVGGPLQRDAAYHQGTAWPWLFGGYMLAYMRVYGQDPKTIAFARQLYLPFKRRLDEAGIGTISEIFDGDPPHVARGCISQAWSVAEILRSYARLAFPVV